jgi:subtilisin
VSKNSHHRSRIGRLRLSLPVALMLMAVLFGSVAATAQAQPAAQTKVLIAFAHQPGPAEQALVHRFGGDIRYTYHLVPGIAATVPEAALDGLRRSPSVVAVEPDVQVHVTDAELDSVWGVERIGAGIVHAQGNLGAGVKIGILDTGIDLDHPDLAYDPNCSVNFVEGETLDDGNGHGTHVAGTIAGLDNDSGVVGVAPGATLCIYKVLDNTGSGNYGDIIAAVEQAMTQDVQVTNNSYGSSEDPGYLVQMFFDAADAAGILQIGAAGNDGNLFGIGENCIYPARWASVVATAATTQDDTRAYFSSTCPEVELVAPGWAIYSTVPDGDYGIKYGTSMASPHAAGTAALVLAAHPGWSHDQVRVQLQNTADDLGDAGRDPWYGFGLVDADEAAGASNNSPVADDQTVTTDEDAPVGITLTASDADGDPLTYDVHTHPSDGTLSGMAPDLTYTPDLNYNGPDSFTFVANDGAADSNTATVSITVSPVNDPPVADYQTVNTDEDTPVAITLTGSDPDADLLTFSVVSEPSHGALSGTPPDLTYTPDPDYSGPDSFDFVANDGQMDSNLATVSITVGPVNDLPSAGFTYACTGLSCDFDASASSDVEGPIANYAWDFGDGSTGSGVTPRHTFAAGGTYTVVLTVTDDGGAFDSDTQTVVVSETAASTHIGDLDGNLANANKKFWWAQVTITVHDNDEGPVTDATAEGTWSGGASGSGSCLTGADGRCTVLSPKAPSAQESIAFTVDNVAHATLPYDSTENHDPDGDSDGITIEVSQFGNQPPVAQFTCTCTDLTCAFDGSGSFDPEGGIISYAWDLGDGTSASEATTNHTYAAEGTYTVVLSVTDADNATGTESQNVPVGVGTGTMFVSDITMSGKTAGPNRSATAVVTVHDVNNNPVAGATVSATWNGDYDAGVSGVTAGDGTVSFSSGKVRQADATFDFTVADVLHSAFTYDPDNSQIFATITVP